MHDEAILEIERWDNSEVGHGLSWPLNNRYVRLYAGHSGLFSLI